jgi:hypothetical protein
MTAAVASSPARPAPTWHLRLSLFARLLRTELRRNAMPWMLPPVAVLFWLAVYRPVMALPPLWALRAITMQLHMLYAFGPLVAGAAAWMGSRDGRRRTAELIAATAWPRWPGRLATLAATTCWGLVAVLAGVAVLYGVTATQATWGGPLWWPPAVDAACVVAFCALGYAAGSVFPSRFTPPLAAVASVVAVLLAFRADVARSGHPSPYALVLPTVNPGGLPFTFGIFYPYLPDVSIVSVVLLAGLLAAALGALGLPRPAGGIRLRSVAAALAAAGLAASGTAIGLAGTARSNGHGMYRIAAFHNTAGNRPTPYTLACSTAAIPVCLHPAFRPYLASLAATLGPVASGIAGLPGVPARVDLLATAGQPANRSTSATLLPGLGTGTVSGNPPVLHLPFNRLPGMNGLSLRQFDAGVLETLVQSVVVGTSPAQQAVEGGLVATAGIPLRYPGESGPAPAVFDGLPRPGYAAAERFAALAPAARRAWLAAHLAALRADRVTLADLP